MRTEHVTKLQTVKESNGCCNKAVLLEACGQQIYVGCKCKLVFPMTEAALAFFKENPGFDDILLIPFSHQSKHGPPQYFKADPQHRRFENREPRTTKTQTPTETTTQVPLPKFLKTAS